MSERTRSHMREARLQSAEEEYMTKPCIHPSVGAPQPINDEHTKHPRLFVQLRISESIRMQIYNIILLSAIDPTLTLTQTAKLVEAVKPKYKLVTLAGDRWWLLQRGRNSGREFMWQRQNVIDGKRQYLVNDVARHPTSTWPSQTVGIASSNDGTVRVAKNFFFSRINIHNFNERGARLNVS